VIANRYRISGRVQGVGYRYYAVRAAQEIGISGWARNLADGDVEVHANGSPEQLSEFEARLRKGPPHSDVRGFKAEDAAPTDASDFRIR
jgi:acylphosphatase